MLQDRKLAAAKQRGPFPIELIFTLASTLQVVDTLFDLFIAASRYQNQLDPKDAEPIAEWLFYLLPLVASCGYLNLSCKSFTHPRPPHLCQHHAGAAAALKALMDGWLQLPGVSIALESGLRHMGSSEPASSPLRASTLLLVMVESDMLQRSWGETQVPSHGLSGRTPSPHSSCLNLYMTLHKSLSQSLAEGPPTAQVKTNTNRANTRFPPHMLLLEIARFTRFHRSMWEGKSMMSPLTAKHQIGSSGGSGGTRSSNLEDSAELCNFQTWLRVQLILLRSWVLLWIVVFDLSKNPITQGETTA